MLQIVHCITSYSVSGYLYWTFAFLSVWSFPEHSGPSLAVYLETVRVMNTSSTLGDSQFCATTVYLTSLAKLQLKNQGKKETVLIRSTSLSGWMLSQMMDAFTNDVFITRGKCSACHLHKNKHQGPMI